MSIYNRISLYGNNISNRKVYRSSLYLIEMSISIRITLYEMSISNQNLYTKILYEKFISN